MVKHWLFILFSLFALQLGAVTVSGIVRVGSPLAYSYTQIYLLDKATVIEKTWTDNDGFFSMTVDSGLYVIQYVSNSAIIYQDTIVADRNISMPFFSEQGGRLDKSLRGIVSHTVEINDVYYVNRGDSLTVLPGVVMFFGEKGRIIVNGGTLLLKGSVDQRIILTATNSELGWGGIEIVEGGGAEMENADILLPNKSALTIQKSALFMDNCFVENISLNSNIYKYGAAISASDARVFIANTKITNSANFTKKNVSGILADNSTVTVVNTIIEGFESEYYSPAIYVRSGSLNVVNSNIAKNIGLSDGLSAVSVSLNSEGITILNTIFFDNLTGAGNLSKQIETEKVSIIANNLMWNSDSLLEVNDPDFVDYMVYNTKGGEIIDGNMIADPGFINTITYDFLSSSPLVDAGSFIIENLDFYPQYLQKRIVDGNVDGIASIDIGVTELEVNGYWIAVPPVSETKDSTGDYLSNTGGDKTDGGGDVVLIPGGSDENPSDSVIWNAAGDYKYMITERIYNNIGGAVHNNGKSYPLVYPSPSNMLVCPYIPVEITDAKVENYDYLRWETLDGSGVFSSTSSLKTVYTPSIEDYIAGGVVIRITAFKGNPGVSESHTFYVDFLTYVSPIELDNIEACGYYEFKSELSDSYTNVLWNGMLQGNSFEQEYFKSSIVAVEADYFGCRMYDTLRIEITEIPDADFEVRFIQEEGIKGFAFDKDDVLHVWTLDGEDEKTNSNVVYPVSQGGTYELCHIVSLGACSDTSCQMKTVELKETFHIGGQIFANGLPVENAHATLYKKEDGVFVQVKSNDCGELGYFHFSGISEGDYTVLVALTSHDKLYGEYLPTFYGDVQAVSDASVISIKDAPLWRNNIAMNKKSTVGVSRVSKNILQFSCVSDVLLLSEDIDGLVKVYSVAGELLLTADAKEVSVEHLPETMYLISTLVNGKLLSEKFFIVR